MNWVVMSIAVVLVHLSNVRSVALGLGETDCAPRFRRVFESQIDPGDSIDVYLLNGAWVRGRFDGPSADTSRIRVRTSLAEPASYALSDLGILKYRKVGRFRPDVMVAGLFAGTVIGALATAALTDDPCGGSEFCIPPAVAGGLYGGGIGLVLGTIMPPMIPSTRTVRCGVE